MFRKKGHLPLPLFAYMIKSSSIIVAFIEKTRKEKKVSQVNLAKKLLTGRRNYQKMVSGDVKMSTLMAERAAEILGVKVIMVDKGLLK